MTDTQTAPEAQTQARVQTNPTTDRKAENHHAINHGHVNQFALLGQRRLGPFFLVQFLGVGNDNVFRFAFSVLVTYQLQLGWLPAALAGLVIGGVFILPFVLFSATSGQLAEKYPKEELIRRSI